MKEDGYILDPGEFVVGFTAEKLTLPQGIYCILGTRGSRAQLGLDVLQSSTLVEPGSDNQLALKSATTRSRAFGCAPAIGS